MNIMTLWIKGKMDTITNSVDCSADEVDQPCLYGELLTEVLFRCDISTLVYLYALTKENQEIPSPLFGYTLGNFQQLLKAEKVIFILCTHHLLPKIKTFPDFQLAFDKHICLRRNVPMNIDTGVGQKALLIDKSVSEPLRPV